MLLLNLFFSASLAVAGLAAEPVARADSRPNIVFILTDDQDHRMNSLDYMQGVQTHLVSCINFELLLTYLTNLCR